MIRSTFSTAGALAALLTIPSAALADPGPDDVDADVAIAPDAVAAANAVSADRDIVRDELEGLLEAERRYRFHSAIGKFVMGAGMIGLGTYFLVDDTEFQDESNRLNRYIGASFIAASAVPIGLGIWRLLTPAPFEVGVGDLLADENMSAESGLAMLHLVAERDRQMRVAGATGSIVFGGIGLGIGSLLVREDGLSDRAGWITIAFAGLSVAKGTWGLFGRSPGERRYERALGRLDEHRSAVVDLDVSPSFGLVPEGGYQGGVQVSGRF